MSEFAYWMIPAYFLLFVIWITVIFERSKQIEGFKRQITRMREQHHHTVEILAKQYEKAFREMFAEETKKRMAERA